MIADLQHRLDDGDTLFRCHERREWGAGGRPALGEIFEELRNIAFEHVSNIEQQLGTYPVAAFFVFLNLVEREAESLAQIFLTHPDFEAARLNTRGYQCLDVGILCRTHRSLSGLVLGRVGDALDQVAEVVSNCPVRDVCIGRQQFGRGISAIWQCAA